MPVWDAARQLVAGDLLGEEVRNALDESLAFVVVLSPRTINAGAVRQEILYALALRERRGAGYPVIPLMLDGVEPTALRLWFPSPPLGMRLEVGPGGIQRALPALLDALGLALPIDAGPSTAIAAAPIADLTLELTDPFVDRAEGRHRGAATAELIYTPPEVGARQVRSRRFRLVAPLGPIETEELRWYLERYAAWPSGVFRERAKALEARLPEWGLQLHRVLEHHLAGDVYRAWRDGGNGAVRRLTVLVDPDPVVIGAARDEAGTKRPADADEAASLLLALPWELLRDDVGYLFHGPEPVRVRRRLPFRKAKAPLVTEAPLRVLLLSPRPEDECAAYLDHRVSARPVVEAVSTLGSLAVLKLLNPPTFPALAAELDAATRRGEPYHVVHFDGHGMYSRQTGLGALCFEHPEDSGKLAKRRSDIIEAAELAAVMRDQRVPLFFLEACQTAAAEKDPTASVAGALLQGGVASVVAMSHSVLVETARRFVTEFYRQLLIGRRIGEAMVAGQRELKAHTLRDRSIGGELHLQDWFVPVLFQEAEDPQLIHEVPPQRVGEVLGRQRTQQLGELPLAPAHGFVGRSRELLAAERVLETHAYVVLCGGGGEGKTTLAAELALWLMDTQRFERVAFASLELHGDARPLLHALGHQLVPGFESVAAQDPGRSWLEVERSLRERRTLVVLDNMETVLPPEPGAPGEDAFEEEVLRRVLELAARLNEVASTRLIFTSRQPMPAPFADNHLSIGRLERNEAVKLVARVLAREERTPRAGDAGGSEDEVSRLVEAVGCHARSLVLLAREVADAGVRHTTEQLTELMRSLQERYPDDRERSLYASVELSLRRLPADMRRAIRPLGVFEGGAHLVAMAVVLGFDLDDSTRVRRVASALLRVGLAEEAAYGYLRFDPALGPLLLSEMTESERAAAREQWAYAAVTVSQALAEVSKGSRPEIASTLALADVANLVGGLESLAELAPADLVVLVATAIELLLDNRGRVRASARAARVREKVSAALGEGSHHRFLAELQAANRAVEARRYEEGVALARAVVERARLAGEGAYKEAASDLALACLELGCALRMARDPAAALSVITEARDRFRPLAAAGDASAEQLASGALTEIGNCLMDLGRLEEAVKAHTEAIALDEKRGSVRDVACGRLQLGIVRLYQGLWREAIPLLEQARRTFEELGESRSVANAWREIGKAHALVSGDHELAEEALKKALRIDVQTGDRSQEAETLGVLGNLYHAMDRPEEAVGFFHQAVTIFQERGDTADEGGARSNLAGTLSKLGRQDEARLHLLRAIECLEKAGSSNLWKPLLRLAELERRTGPADVAAAARQRAREAFLTYRRAGGESGFDGETIVAMVAEALLEGNMAAAESQLDPFEQLPVLPASLGLLVAKLRSVLRGSRDADLPGDPDLSIEDSVELQLLLERLEAGGGA